MEREEVSVGFYSERERERNDDDIKLPTQTDTKPGKREG